MLNKPIKYNLGDPEDVSKVGYNPYTGSYEEDL